MGVQETLEQTLQSREPVNELRALALRLFAEAQTTAVVLASFEAARQRLPKDTREADADAVMDVMDFLVGWCAPYMKLPAEQTPIFSEVKP